VQIHLNRIVPRDLVSRLFGVALIGVAILGNIMKYPIRGEQNEFAWTFIAVIGIALSTKSNLKEANEESERLSKPPPQAQIQRAFFCCLFFAAFAAPLIVWKQILCIPIFAAFALATSCWIRMKLPTKDR